MNQNITTPILSVDESLTTEERLTDNTVENILPARYLIDDETPDEMFRRVAENVAMAERNYFDETEQEWAEEFYDLMSTLRFMPNSPTLMNAGDDLQQLSACISGDTPIYTRGGLKAMADVSEGDEVLTHSGQFKTVTAHWSNGEKETLDVKRGTSRGNNYSVTATADHEFLTSDGWSELQDVDDAIQPVALPDVSVPDSFDLTKYTSIMGKDKPVVSDGGVVKVKNGDDSRTGEYDEQYSEVVASVKNTETFAYLAGAYLAEGDVDGSDLRFTIGADESTFEAKIVEGLQQLFDVHVAVMESNYGNWKTITASSPFISDFFVTQFGTGSTEKRIPEWMFASSDSYQQAVLDGILDGDGHESDNGWKLTLANPTLAYESSLLARNIGYQANFTLEAENELSASPTSRVRISKDSDTSHLNKVSTRSGETQEVFDMEVEDDHSFVAGDFIVHNCFVLEVGDSMTEPDENGRASIAETQTHASAIFKSGGGVGYTFGFLRPKGTHIDSTDSETSGPMAFMSLFDQTCQTVKQGGKRRGAQMAIMPVDHPDIGRFVCSKRSEGDYSNFNISVGLTDEFVGAVQDDDIYRLNDPRDDFDVGFDIVQATKNFFAPSKEDSPESIVDENVWRDYADDMEAWDWENDCTVSFRDKWFAHFQSAENAGNLDVGEELALPARFIWDMMIDGAWRNGEPGLFYMDETNKRHSFDVQEHPEFKINATNPCAEQPLCNFEACNLGHINLSLMVDENATNYEVWRERQDFDYHNESSAVTDFLQEAIDYDELDRTIEGGTRFLDNVIDMSDFPLDEIDETVSAMRKIGLGVMGWAQMCYQLGIEYGSDESYTAAKHIMSYIDAKATRYSHNLAKERGCFGAWEKSKYADPTEYPEWFESHAYVTPEEYKDGYKMRNHNVTTVAPTGTTSMIADTSGGIEPVFSVAYQKNVGNDIQGAENLVEFDSYFVKTLEANGYNVDDMKQMAATQMDENRFEGVQSLPIHDSLKDLFVTTNDLSSAQHGRMQRAFQHAVDSGISKTINLPKEAKHNDVHEAYMLALTDNDVGAPIKGLTVYRDQSRAEQVKTTQKYSDLEVEQAVEMLEELDGYSITKEEENSEEAIVEVTTNG